MKKKRKQGPLCAQVKQMLRREGVKVRSSRCMDTEFDHPKGGRVRLVSVQFSGFWSGKR
jgi:hypothetical protein